MIFNLNLIYKMHVTACEKRMSNQKVKASVVINTMFFQSDNVV